MIHHPIRSILSKQRSTNVVPSMIIPWVRPYAAVVITPSSSSSLHPQIDDRSSHLTSIRTCRHYCHMVQQRRSSFSSSVLLPYIQHHHDTTTKNMNHHHHFQNSFGGDNHPSRNNHMTSIFKSYLSTTSSSSNTTTGKSSGTTSHTNSKGTSSSSEFIVDYMDTNKLLQQNPFIPMTKEQESYEKQRVQNLSSTDKDMELRILNRQIAILEMKHAINTGELYTWTGKYKMLAKNYGVPLFIWYWTVWITTGLTCYSIITLFNVDVIVILQQLEYYTGYNVTQHIDPLLGKIGVALVANEVIEPIRLPFVIVTVKPVMDRIFPTKY